MAHFIVRVLKSLAALVVAYFVLFLVLILLLAGLAAAFQPKAAPLEEDSILVMDLGFELTDRPRDPDPLALLFSAFEGKFQESASLRDVVETIEEAGKDNRIHGLLLQGNLLPGSSFAAMREVRRAIRTLAQKKPVYAHIDGDNLRDLYLKSAAGEVISDPHASADFRGLRAERLYLGEAFQRLGVEVQVEAFEDFKTAAEAFKKGTMSEEEAIQLRALLEDLWTVLIEDMGESRGIEPDELDALAGNQLIVHGEEIPGSGLADRALPRDELVSYLAEQAAYDSERESFRQVAFMDYLQQPTSGLPDVDLSSEKSEIAILYVEGAIIEGESDELTTGAETLIRDLREARLDSDVKAIVLRVNSPGGSATAAMKIAREIRLANAAKPVVASMGGMAASAGYLLAVACDQVYAEPSTITGSIGVIIMLPNVAGLAERLSLNFEEVETHPFAGAFSLARSKTPEEMDRIRSLASQFYDAFLELVAEQREMSRETVREHARGRVWSGRSALERGLVDSMGGLFGALGRAGDLAGIGNDFRIREWPERRSLEEQIEQFLMSADFFPRRKRLSDGAIGQAWRDFEDEIKRLSVVDDPQGAYLMLPYSLKIR